VPHWIKSGIKIREASCFMMTTPTPFARHNPLRLLALWNVEGSLERSRVELEQWNWRGDYEGLRWIHFRWTAQRLPQLDEPSCIGYWEWERIYYLIDMIWFPRMSWISKSEGLGTFFTSCMFLSPISGFPW
jgi:hypothetical protein